MALSREQLEEYWRMKNEGVEDRSGPIGEGYGDKPQGLLGRTGYEQAVMDREAAGINEARVDGVKSEVGGMNSTGVSMGAKAATDGAANGNATQTLGGGVMTAGAMTGNPVLMGAGLGLQVLAAGATNKRNAKEAERQAYNDRIANRQQIMTQIAQQGIK